MKLLLYPALVLASLGASSVVAGPQEQAILAAMKLTDAPNYSWTATVADDAMLYTLEGKTEKGGFTWVKMPMVRTIARRLGREGDTQLQLFFAGASACVVQTNDGWKTIDELPRRRPREHDEPFVVAMGTMPGGRMGTLGGPLPLATAPTGRLFKDDSDKRPHSNLQLGVSHPHEELSVIVGSHVTLRADGDVVSGTLSDIGAQLLLVRDGAEDIAPLAAAGVFKLWLKDQRVVRYQLQLEGLLEVGRKRVVVRQDSTTTLHAVGTTRLDVPLEVREKLAR